MKKCPYCLKEIQDDVTVCPFCGRNLNDLARPAHWFWYLVIGLAGLFGLSITPSLLILPAILASKQPSDAALIIGSLISLGVFPALWWIAAKGKYSKVNFWGFGNMTMVSLVPFVGGWWCIYYFGKGVYMLFTKQKLPIPNNPIKAGGILLICSVVIGLLIWGITSSQPVATQVPNPTQLPTAAPYVYSTQDASLFFGFHSNFSTILCSMGPDHHRNGRANDLRHWHRCSGLSCHWNCPNTREFFNRAKHILPDFNRLRILLYDAGWYAPRSDRRRLRSSNGNRQGFR
jgi:hypothetical protein